MKQIYLLLLINFCSTVFLKTPIQAQKKLSIIGSSTAQCFGITGDSCFVGRLKNFYGNAVQFTNLAVSGSNVYRGMPSSYTPPAERVNETPDINYNITAALSSNPEVVLVNYPSNGYDVFSVAEVMFCLRTINAAAITAGARCYITTTQPRSDPASFTSGETRRKMAEIKDSVLQQFGTFAINFWDGIVNPADSTIITELGQGDGTHLNNKGHAILFQKVKDKDIFLLNSPLPLSFVGFSATTGNGETTLQWITAMEKNIRHFELMRSIDGIQFSKIATIKANNTMQNNRYSFTDKSPLPATSYYQVVAINLNSHPDYSQTIKVL
ncbi:MAG: SGNH/GDSL hydrolase family protein, partial [Chitinophagaceae bacterium]